MSKRKLFAVAGFNLLSFLVLLELTGLVDYFVKTRELYYLSRARAELLPELVGLELRAEAHRLHPYFGFVLAPSTAAMADGAGRAVPLNNYGFGSPFDYPYRPRSERELVAGIFGGSVAAKLARFESRRQILRPSLAAAFGREPSEVTVLSFAQGGFKQPQQLLIYHYFRALGQRLDVVVNVDGFNEIALSARNVRAGVAVEMPSMAHLSALRQLVGGPAAEDGGDSGLGTLLGVRESYARYSRMHGRASSGKAWELTFAGGFFLDRKLTKLYRKRFNSELLAYHELIASGSEDSWLYLNPLPAPAGDPPADSLATIVGLWAEASSMLHSAQSQNGGTYLHFVQPNQYLPTNRVYDERERATAFDPRSPFAEPIRVGYPRLRQELSRLRAEGVPVYDLTELFDNLEAAAYADDCCHYTDAGQEALARAIAEAVGAAARRPAPTIDS